MSGTPDFAVIAFCNEVYWSFPVPTLTRSTFTFGYFFSNSVATCFRVLSHAHTFSVPPAFSEAWRSVSDTVVELLEPSVLSDDEPQAETPRETLRASAALEM